ncbi:DMT family transporter [Ovoidimarina sediminis]|uniref:DMT family transporter n=1 Tax=Ovoidimarina sediminis TaxID=3079856 RepID=UPI00290BC466|nr:DMT family transporter [Rhodophyticola sp. MJ-SS7]MDU8945020.1 DMT family transporter [Rhodophyticola sp. MJ-SS7]
MVEVGPTDNTQPLKAAAWMTGGIASFSAMAVAGRELADVHDTFEMMLFRSVVGIVLVVVIAGALGRLGEISTRRMDLHIGRNIFHFTGQNLWFYAVTVIPLAQVFALEFTSPIWVALLAPLVLGEKLTRVRILSAVLGFIGVLLVAQPGAEPVSPGILLAALAAMCFAATFLFTKKLTRVASITCILFWLTVVQAVIGVLFVFWDGVVAWPTAATLPWLVLIGCAGLFAHLCVTNALAIAPATLVVPMDFLRLPLIAVVGMVIYGEPLNALVIAGAVIIFAANYLNIWTETRR